MPKEKIGIVGFGRFGRLWTELFSDYEVLVYDKFKKPAHLPGFAKSASLKELFSATTVFYCVPIHSFESSLREHLTYITPEHLLIDVLSVKMLPLSVFSRFQRAKGFSFMLTHPLFGPDSFDGSFKGKKIVIGESRGDKKRIRDWTAFFKKKGMDVILKKAREHDREMAKTQVIVHFLARVLNEYDFYPVFLKTKSIKALYEIRDDLNRDTLDLFYDMILYNPFALTELFEFERSKERVVRRIFEKKRKQRKEKIFGIQGGRGSFNEMALKDYTTQKDINSFKTKYLYTTERVLRALSRGEIDYGVFAFFNSRGGWVRETLDAVQRYYFRVVDVVGLNISHHLMIKKKVPFFKIKRVMAHPQVFRQCENNLKKRYPHLERITGKGELIDTAKAAKALWEGKLPSSTAILGPEILADIYDFEVVERNLQDLKDNTTYFLVVKR